MEIKKLTQCALVVFGVFLFAACGGGVGSSGGGSGGGTGSGGFNSTGFGFGFGETPDPNVELWRFVAGNDVTAPAVASDGTIYIGSVDNFLYAVNPDGSEKWKFRSTNGAAINIAPVIGSDGTIYFEDIVGTLYSMNPDGTVKWMLDSVGNGEIAVTEDDTIIVNTGAYNADGSIKWSRAVNNAVIDPHGTGRVYSSDLNVSAIDLANGLDSWVFNPDGAISYSPAIGEDKTLYFGDSDGVFYAVGQDGIERWRFNISGRVNTGTPVIAPDGSIYVLFSDGSGDERLYALASDGTLKWTFRVGLGSTAPVVGADGTVYITTNTMTALNPDGTIKWSVVTFRNGRASSAIDIDGTLLAPLRSTLFALDVETGGLASSAWPMRRQNLRNTAVIVAP